MTFGELYGSRLDIELGTTDRTQRFTTERRVLLANEGIEKFNERTGCYVRRALIALSTTVGEYDLDDAGVLSAGDYIRPSKTSASIRIVNGSSTTYLEGDDFQLATEDELNADDAGWRSRSPGVPTRWYLRGDEGETNVGLHVAPSIPVGQTWTLLFPYVAVPPTLVVTTDDATVLYGGRSSLLAYHMGPLHYAAAQAEKLRKNYDGETMQMNRFSAVIAQYQADMLPARGSRIRMATNYRSRMSMRVGRSRAFGR